jgi:hypothetical protein
MVTVPTAKPVTTPPELTDALLLLLLHTPPATGSVNVPGDPRQIVEGPEIVPAVRTDVIFTILVAIAEPQPLVTVYIIVSNPAETAVSTPAPVMLACILLILHVPPGAASVYIVKPPTHIVDGPTITPATGAALTVTVVVATAVPQLPDTV